MTRAPTVYAFLDESGDTGTNISRGASPYFIVVMVETTEPEKLRTELQHLRQVLNLPATFEFRYHDTRKVAVRVAFFALLRSLDIRIRAAVVDKTRLPQQAGHWSESEMYEYTIGEIVKHSSIDELSEAILVIDGERKRRFVQRLRQYLSALGRAQKRGRVFKAIVLKESKREDGLQFADMVAGVLAETVTHGESAYEDAVNSKMRLLLRLP